MSLLLRKLSRNNYGGQHKMKKLSQERKVISIHLSSSFRYYLLVLQGDKIGGKFIFSDRLNLK